MSSELMSRPSMSKMQARTAGGSSLDPAVGLLGNRGQHWGLARWDCLGCFLENVYLSSVVVFAMVP